MSISIVQQVPKHLATGGSPNKTITIATPGAGNTLFLALTNVATFAATGVTGGGVTWSKVVSVTDAVGGEICELWAGANSSGSGTTITVTYSSAYMGASDATVVEVSGMPSTLTIDPASGATNTGQSGTASTASITPTAGNSLIIFAVASTSAGTTTITNTPSGGFTALTLPTGAFVSTGWGYSIVPSATGSYSTTFPATPSYAHWATVIAGFDGTSSPPPASSPLSSAISSPLSSAPSSKVSSPLSPSPSPLSSAISSPSYTGSSSKSSSLSSPLAIIPCNGDVFVCFTPLGNLITTDGGDPLTTDDGIYLTK